jgi:hypothetical protein
MNGQRFRMSTYRCIEAFVSLIVDEPRGQGLSVRPDRPWAPNQCRFSTPIDVIERQLATLAIWAVAVVISGRSASIEKGLVAEKSCDDRQQPMHPILPWTTTR